MYDHSVGTEQSAKSETVSTKHSSAKFLTQHFYSLLIILVST